MHQSRRDGPEDEDVLGSISRHTSAMYADYRLMPMLQQLVRTTCGLAGAVGGSVSLVDADAGRYTKIAEFGTACHLGQSFPLHEGVTGQVMSRRAPVVLGTYREVQRGHLSSGHPAWDGAVAAIPIWWRADIVAVNVIFAGMARAFTTGEIDHLELVTQVVAPGLVTAVGREQPDRARRRTTNGEHELLSSAAPSASSVSSVSGVVAGLLELAERAGGDALADADQFQVRVIGSGPPRLLMRSLGEDREPFDGTPARGVDRSWRELVDSRSGVIALPPDPASHRFDGAEAAGRPGAPGSDDQPGSPFSTREHQVAVLLTQGLSDRAIASDLCLSPKTVEKHVSAVLRKTRTTNRTAAVVWCLDQGWM